MFDPEVFDPEVFDPESVLATLLNSRILQEITFTTRSPRSPRTVVKLKIVLEENSRKQGEISLCQDLNLHIKLNTIWDINLILY